MRKRADIHPINLYGRIGYIIFKNKVNTEEIISILNKTPRSNIIVCPNAIYNGSKMQHFKYYPQDIKSDFAIEAGVCTIRWMKQQNLERKQSGNKSIPIKEYIPESRGIILAYQTWSDSKHISKEFYTDTHRDTIELTQILNKMNYHCGYKNIKFKSAIEI